MNYSQNKWIMTDSSTANSLVSELASEEPSEKSGWSNPSYETLTEDSDFSNVTKLTTISTSLLKKLYTYDDSSSYGWSPSFWFLPFEMVNYTKYVPTYGYYLIKNTATAKTEEQTVQMEKSNNLLNSDLASGFKSELKQQLKDLFKDESSYLYRFCAMKKFLTVQSQSAGRGVFNSSYGDGAYSGVENVIDKDTGLLTYIDEDKLFVFKNDGSTKTTLRSVFSDGTSELLNILYYSLNCVAYGFVASLFLSEDDDASSDTSSGYSALAWGAIDKFQTVVQTLFDNAGSWPGVITSQDQDTILNELQSAYSSVLKEVSSNKDWVTNTGLSISGYGYTASTGGDSEMAWSLSEYITSAAEALNEILSLDAWQKFNEGLTRKFLAENLIVPILTQLDTETVDNATKENISARGDRDLRVYMRDSTNNVYYIDDYNWSMSPNKLSDMGLSAEDFQSIRIYELQPDRQKSWKSVVNSIAGAAEATANDAANQISSTVFGKNISRSFTDVTKATAAKVAAEAYYKWIEASDDDDSAWQEAQGKSVSVDWVDSLLNGWWVGQYDIPYFGDKFIEGGSSSNWTIGNMLERSDFIINDLTSNVQNIPTWKFDPSPSDGLNTSLYLINDNIQDYKRNLKFAFAITAGAFWLQELSFAYRSPNIYRLVCPGRFVILYAGLNTALSFVGKVKKYPLEDAQKIFGGEGTNYKAFNKFIAEDGQCNIPEAFKLDLKFKDLTPGAFNVYGSYFTNNTSNIIPNISVKQNAS